MKKRIICLMQLSLLLLMVIPMQAQEDPYMWLEEVQGEKALEWVKTQNKDSVTQLEAVPGYKEALTDVTKILNSTERVPFVERVGDYLYNFWRDAQHVRGILRRTTLEGYRKDNPEWETVLDIDQLAKKENENWVYKGRNHLHTNENLCLLHLSRGGADAVVLREFDVAKKTFVTDGFQLPEAKTWISWIDENAVFVSTDFGEGSLNTSGYPRIVKIWKRGTPLKDAQTIMESPKDHVFAYGNRLWGPDGYFDYIVDSKSFFESDYYALVKGKLKKLDIPNYIDISGYFQKQIILSLRNDWKVGETTYTQGSVIAGNVENLLAGKKEFQVIATPSKGFSIDSVKVANTMLVVTALDNVVSKLFQFSLDDKGNWQRKEIAIKDNGTLSIHDISVKHDDYMVVFENFLTPDSLYLVSGKEGKAQVLKSGPAYFDSTPLMVKQFFATSKDGTKVPYFAVMNKETKLDGHNPTLLYGYGGFLVSMQPVYSGALGKAWLEKGGVFVMSNIRGGAEYGPQWHKAALLKNRHKAFEDFIAVAEDLISRKITSPSKLAIQGGSNGGLLVGAVFLMRPELFKGVVCQVPLLDMKRYNKLLAGASWQGEYGNPDDPDMWNYIKTYSPYQNVKKDVKYPEVFFYTSTRDDRVHPGHARKMVAKMKDMGHKVFYYENTEGGHAGAANNAQRAYMTALSYAYLYKMLMGK